MMFDHALVSPQFVPSFGGLVAFFCHRPLVWILLFGHMPTPSLCAPFWTLSCFFCHRPLVWILLFGHMPMPSLTDKDCHDVACLWGWQWVRQDNQDMKAKAVMHWT